jgi:DNA-binding transcriptional ArsR family regulator
VKQRTGSATKKAVLMALANAASHHTATCEPKIDLLAEETELNERTVRRALDDLAEAGLIEREMRHKANGHRAGYVYSFPRLADTLPGSQDGLPDALSGELPDPLPGQELDQEVQEQDLEEAIASSRSEREERVGKVVAAWKRDSPPLIEHRSSYFADRKTTNAIERAFQTYPVEAVCNAIFNYSSVLGSDTYRWDYRWTIIDFLKRGLDRFVDEALPLDNFRIRNAEKFGRRDVSAREFEQAAERIEADQRRLDGIADIHGRQLESG